MREEARGQGAAPRQQLPGLPGPARIMEQSPVSLIEKSPLATRSCSVEKTPARSKCAVLK